MKCELNKEELNLLLGLCSERKAEMERNLLAKDEQVYLQICGLSGKLQGYLYLIKESEKTSDCKCVED